MSLRDGLVGEYCFRGDAADTSGHGRHGVVHGATLTADRFGAANAAYSFDGVNDFIEVAPPPDFAADALSVSAWVRYAPRNFDGWTNSIVAQDDGNDLDQSRRVFQLSTDSGHIVWHRMVGSRDPMSKRPVRPGEWTHAVAVHDRGVNRLYIDGELQDTVEHKMWTNAAQPMHIGRKGTPEVYFFFRGDIDDVRIYDRALTIDDIAALLHEGGWSPPVRTDLPTMGDPISGRWGRHGVAYLDLRYDGDRRVSGYVMDGVPSNMAAIETGVFDRTNGHLRLDGRARHYRTGETAAFVVDGMLAYGELTVRADVKDFSGNFILTRAGARLRLNRRSLRSHAGSIAFRLRELFGGS